MRPRSELEDFLQRLHADGRLDSTGEFTLAREKALDKLAAFLLPRPTAWASKVVQAVVLSGASALAVKQTSLGTEFHFHPQEELTLDALEASFFAPETGVHPALDHLRQALWSVSLNGMRPFHYARKTEALVWTGSAFQRTTCRPTDGSRLTVSHRTVWEGQGLPGLRSLEAARLNSETALELAERAFVCPIPLTLDGRRLDRLQASCGATSIPLALVYTDADLPPLKLPPGTFTKTAPRPGALNPLILLEQEPERVAAACVIAAHAGKAEHARHNVYRGLTCQSVFHWVRHGVVVDTHFINELDAGSVTCAVIASAEGLRGDLAGFSVARDEPARARQAAIYAALNPLVQDVPFTLQPTGYAALGGLYTLGSGLLYCAGSALTGGFLPGAVALVAAGLGMYVTRHADADEEFVQSLRVSLERLQRGWPVR